MTSRKAASAAPTSDEQVGEETAPVTAPIAEAEPPAGDEAGPPNPHEGGCYVRLPNGDLKREDD